jgi:phage shock protein A
MGVTQQLIGTSTLSPQDDWLRRAELAVSKGEDELAREALKKRKAYQVRRSVLGWTWQKQACPA